MSSSATKQFSQHRDLRSQPDPKEPRFADSDEEKSFFNQSFEEKFEQERVHIRRQGSIGGAATPRASCKSSPGKPRKERARIKKRQEKEKQKKRSGERMRKQSFSEIDDGRIENPFLEREIAVLDNRRRVVGLRSEVDLRIDRCEAFRKKRLMLNNLALTALDLPLNELCETALGKSLYKLSLAGNRLGCVPGELVRSLPVLEHLDLSQCELHSLPETWLLPKLKSLNLSHNRLTEFPESMMAGLRALQELNMYGNKVGEIIVPSNKKLLSKLETLDLGYNDVVRLPDDLDQLKSLRTLKVGNNFLNKIPMRVCDMNLETIDVSSNPVTEPPIETCERGFLAMRRYWNCIRMEEQFKPRATVGIHEKLQQKTKKKRPRRHTNASRAKNTASAAQTPPPLRSSSGAAQTPPPLRSTIADSVNDTLKVVVVGMEEVGKTSIIKRLIDGEHAIVPTIDERTVGVDIYDWEPKNDKRFEHIDSRIEIQNNELAEACGDVDVKFSVWDFAGQHVYHATHELFFSNRAFYVVVWDMGASNKKTLRPQVPPVTGETGASKFYDSDDERDLANDEEERRADSELEHDIDEKIQFWVDCIQSKSPGAAILPVASFNDKFSEKLGGEAEAKRRCDMLKHRLLKHEARRVEGVKKRLQALNDQKRADDAAALRLQSKLSKRPRLIFDDGDNVVVRVSGSEYTGFGRLAEKIIRIATGKNRCGGRYPLFNGHIGARIPRMRLEVRKVVRALRGDAKVVEWGHFINLLRDRGLTNVDDIRDALHFLTSTGELSYFGRAMTRSQPLSKSTTEKDESTHLAGSATLVQEKKFDDLSEEDEVDDKGRTFFVDNTDLSSEYCAREDLVSQGLSQFVFLNPRWLVAAVACILRHDLDRKIKETRKVRREFSRTASLYNARLSCPVVSSDDARLLLQPKCNRIAKKTAECGQEDSNKTTVTPFEFLQKLLIWFGVLVPIDLSVERALFGGVEYAEDLKGGQRETKELLAAAPCFFFLPSLLAPCEPSDIWTYRSSDFSMQTICNSILFPDGVPSGLMERLTARVLSSIYAASNHEGIAHGVDNSKAVYEGKKLSVKEVLCWRSAFLLKIETQIAHVDGTTKTRVVEIFAHLMNRESDLCLGSEDMGAGEYRLIISGKGQTGRRGHNIWFGGYRLVIKCLNRVAAEYDGLEFEKHCFCPECLAKKVVGKARYWEHSLVQAAVRGWERNIRCTHGHVVDTCLISGPDSSQKPRLKADTVPVQDLLPAVVMVGLWNGDDIRMLGSGFIVDKEHGLIVTAAHTLMNIWAGDKDDFGDNYFGYEKGEVVIGVLPSYQNGDGKDLAVYRYFARIECKDSSFAHYKECHLDACVLRITGRMKNDVDGDAWRCCMESRVNLLNNRAELEQEQLPTLKITEKWEREQKVRLIGFNQGGESLYRLNEHMHRHIDFAKGHVCTKLKHDENPPGKVERYKYFKPREEIVVICTAIGGHSGGPCVNQQGDVIGILSRTSNTDPHRNYFVPASELNVLVQRARDLVGMA